MTNSTTPCFPNKERTRQILDLAVSKSNLRHYAYCPDEALPETIFIDLAGHWVVHAELGLDYSVKVKEEDLPEAFQRYGMYCTDDRGDNTFLVYAWKVRPRIRVLSDGRTQMILDSFNQNLEAPTLSLTPDSLARLVHFIDKAIPQVVETVEKERLNIERHRKVEEIAVRGLSLVLDEMGVTSILSYAHGDVEACIGLQAEDLELRFTVPLEDVQEMAGKMRDIVAAANVLGNEYWTSGMSIHRWFEP